MARIKFTGPASAVQMQAAPTRNAAVTTAVRNKSQTEEEMLSQLVTQEKQLIKQQQSLEMVQIMLHVGFGTLFYLRFAVHHKHPRVQPNDDREFLPLGCFEDRDLRQAQREQRTSYQDFIGGNAQPAASPDAAFGKGKKGQPLKVIIRNSDPKADTILDLLENGIFDALRNNVLEAIQLTILVDEDSPNNVLESYTFSFKYTKGVGDMDSRLESLSLDPVGCVADMKTAQTARMGLEMMVRRLITLSAFLPTLPNKRNLGIHLFYNENCPMEYEPPGFVLTEDDTIKFPRDENWRKETQSCGFMESGCHTVGLQITSLKWTGPDTEGSDVSPKIPLHIEYNDEVQRSADVGFIDEEQSLLASGSSRTGSWIEATQDVNERHKLQMMIPTQGTTYPDSNLIPTQPLRFTDNNEGMGPPPGSKICLSCRKVSEINQSIRSQNPGFLGNLEYRNGGHVKCQCGWNGEEAAMIECTFCHTYQHLLCYGFQGSDDPRRPQIHACYQCLLEPQETYLLREMNTLVLLRRALRIILDEGYPSKTSLFTQKLHCNGQTVLQITDLLRKQGFIQPTAGYKTKGFQEKGLPKFTVPQAKEIRQQMEMEILNPLAKIQHHYVFQDTEASVDDSESTNPGESFPEKSYSQTRDLSMQEYDTNALENQGSQWDAVSVENDLGHKRKQSPNAEDTDGSDDLEYIYDTMSNRKGSYQNSITTESHRAGPFDLSSTQGTTQTHEETDTSVLRRSNRKRRKISNFARLIDVGNVSSSEEGI